MGWCESHHFFCACITILAIGVFVLGLVGGLYVDGPDVEYDGKAVSRYDALVADNEGLFAATLISGITASAIVPWVAGLARKDETIKIEKEWLGLLILSMIMLSVFSILSVTTHSIAMYGTIAPLIGVIVFGWAAFRPLYSPLSENSTAEERQGLVDTDPNLGDTNQERWIEMTRFSHTSTDDEWQDSGRELSFSDSVSESRTDMLLRVAPDLPAWPSLDPSPPPPPLDQKGSNTDPGTHGIIT